MPNNKFRTETFGTLSEYVELVQTVSDEWDLERGSIWYRGLRDHRHALVPKLYRGNFGDEDSVVHDFMISWPSIDDVRTNDSWEKYGLMQHFGLPTRLLDWTKSPLIALYFALDPERDLPGGAVVWVMDPYELNRITIGRNEVFVPSNLVPEERDLSIIRYLPESLRMGNDPIPDVPLAIEPPLFHRRIGQQQGCFVVFGESRKPLEHYFSTAQSRPALKLQPHKKANLEAIRAGLFSLGLTEDVVWQDLAHLSTRIVRERSGTG